MVDLSTRAPVILFFTSGLPGSGKTTISKYLQSKGVKWVSRDLCRKEFGEYSPAKEQYVVSLMKCYAQGYMLDGKDVVIDCTSTTVGDRAKFADWGKQLWQRHHVRVKKICLYTPCELETSLERRKGELPEEVIRRMAQRLIVPTSSAEAFEVLTINAMAPPSDEILFDRTLHRPSVKATA